MTSRWPLPILSILLLLAMALGDVSASTIDAGLAPEESTQDALPTGPQDNRALHADSLAAAVEDQTRGLSDADLGERRRLDGARRAAPLALHQAGGGRGDWTDHACADCLRTLAADDDAIWAGTYSAGILRHDRRTGEIEHFDWNHGQSWRGVDAIALGPGGDVWASVSTGMTMGFSDPLGLIHFDGRAWTLHDEADGLPSSSLRDIAAGPSGQVFVATAAGFGIYDGNQWSTPSAASGIPPGEAMAVAFHPDGTLWAGSDAGLARFDGSRWQAVSTDVLGSTEVHDLVTAPDGSLWAGIGGILAHYDLGAARWTSYPDIQTGSPGQNDRITVDDAGEVWVAYDLNLHHFDGERWRELDLYADYLNQHAAHWPIGLFVGKDGTAYLAFVHEGLAEMSGASWQRRLSGTGPSKLVSFSVAIDRDDDLWVGSFPMLDESRVLDRFDGNRWTRVTTDDGMIPGDALGILPGMIDTDALGNVWVGVIGAGIAKHDGNTWSAVLSDTLGTANIYALAADEAGGAWIGTDLGALHYDATGMLTRFTEADGLAGDEVRAIELDPQGSGETVWFGTTAGVSRFDGNRWSSLTTADGLAGPEVDAIAVEPNGTLWFGTREGLSRYDGQRWTTFKSGDGLGSNRYWDIEVDPQGYVWVVPSDSADGVGLRRFDGLTWEPFTMADGLMDDRAFDITFDRQGNAWIATFGGVSELVPPPAADPVPAACMCSGVREVVPADAIRRALTDPASISGWGQRRNPSAPAGPWNPLRECLTIRDTGRTYHSLYNGLIWRAGCP